MTSHDVCNSFGVLLPSVTFPMVGAYEVVDLEGGDSRSPSPGKKKCECCSMHRMDLLDWFHMKRGCTASMHIQKPDLRRLKSTNDEDVAPVLGD